MTSMRPHRQPLKLPRWFSATVVLYTAIAGFVVAMAVSSSLFSGHGCSAEEGLICHTAKLPVSAWLIGVTVAALLATVTRAALSPPRRA